MQAETVIGTTIGGTIVAAIARFFIIKTLTDLTKISEKIEKISAQLAVIEVRLDQLDRLEESTSTHDREIIAIQSRLNYERPRVANLLDKS